MKKIEKIFEWWLAGVGVWMAKYIFLDVNNASVEYGIKSAQKTNVVFGQLSRSFGQAEHKMLCFAESVDL